MKPTLFGYGLTTRAIARSLGGGCIFFDDNIDTSYSDDDKIEYIHTVCLTHIRVL